MTLTEFLLERIADDEAAALEATPGPWDAGERIVWSDADTRDPYVVTDGDAGDGGAFSPENAAHIARHDPARVLAECEAKRQIVQRERANGIGRPDAFPWNTATLATIYADHPDYREEWRP